MTTSERPARPTRRLALGGALATVGALAAAAFFGQRSLIYYPERSAAGSAAGLVPGGEDVTLRTSDGLALDAWLVRPTGIDRRTAVLYLPGNGGHRAGRAPAAVALAEAGFTTMLVDYRGYGGNPGSPSEEGLARDAEAALDRLRAAGFAAERTIYVGESLGTGVATRLATTHPPAALLLRSPFTSLPDAARAAYGVPLGWVMRDRYDTASRIGQVACPVTVLAGADDEIVPATQSAAVAARARTLHEHVELPGVGHNDDLWVSDYLAERVSDLAAAAVRG